MSKSLQQKFQDIVFSELIERDDKFYVRLDDYFENEEKFSRYWQCFNEKLQPSQITIDSDETLKAWEEAGLIPAEGASTYIGCIWIGVLIELDRWGLALKSKLKIAEQLRKPYKHSQYGLLEFYACFADFGEAPVEIIVTRDRRAVIGGFYELAKHKESIDFPSYISISLNQVIQKVSQRKSNVKFDGAIWASKAEAKILSIVQTAHETNKIEVNLKKGVPDMLISTKNTGTTNMHEALAKSSSFAELRTVIENDEVAYIEAKDKIKL